MENHELNKAIKEAEKACKHKFLPNTSLIERMRPWAHLNNLYWIKVAHLLEKNKKDGETN